VIVLSLVLVIAAAVLLVLGVFQDGLLLIYLSIASCLLAMGLLGVGVLLRRRGGVVAAGAPATATAGGGAVGGTPVHGRSVGSVREPLDDGPDRDRTVPVRPVGRDATDERADPVAPATAATAAPVSRPAVKKAVVKKAAIRKVSAAAPVRDVTAVAPTEPRPAAVAPPGQAAKKAPLRKVAKKATARKATASVSGSPASVSSSLASVKGLGPAKLDALLARFGDEQGLRDATVEDLTTVRGVGPALAQRIKDAVEG
jgi:DNA uptake protein ComE-like DNA-binding protein